MPSLMQSRGRTRELQASRRPKLIRFRELARTPQRACGQPVKPDDHSEVVPPLPIPNRTVKRLCADDSAGSRVKVGHRQAIYPERARSTRSGPFALAGGEMVSRRKKRGSENLRASLDDVVADGWPSADCPPELMSTGAGCCGLAGSYSRFSNYCPDRASEI